MDEVDKNPQPSLQSTLQVDSNVAEFYRGRSVFITGGTGFLGKVLIEKLLRSCPDIKTIYLLMRPKGGQDILHRLAQEFHKHIMFEKLSLERPEALSKIIPVEGDVSLLNLGLSEADLELLLDKVSLVFNSAATIRFNEKLKTAVQLNVKGPQQLLRICRQMKHLASLVHVSTAFNNLDKKRIEEVVYPTVISPSKLLQIVDVLDDEYLQKISDQLVGKCPNTYTFTKGIAEKLLEEEHGDVPTAIVRPSIVTAASKDPFPGWVDNVNGPTGFIAGTAKGLLRVVRADSEMVADIVPVDFAINLMIAVAWYTSTNQQKSKEIKVFTCSTGHRNPIKWGQLRDYGLGDVRESFPASEAIRYPSVSYLSGINAYLVANFLFHYTPAYIIDFITLIIGKKTKLVKFYKKVDEFVSLISLFSTNEWHFVNDNVILLLDNLSAEDRRIFCFDVRQIDWRIYMKNYSLGVRRYILKDKDETLPTAIINMNRLYWIQKITHFSLLILLVLASIFLFDFFLHNLTINGAALLNGAYY